ncbi:MAG: DUF3300 domain-containing protein [Rhizomicrobium sp.]
MFHQKLVTVFRAIAFAAVLIPSGNAIADTPPATLSDGELDALVAPVALYPDQLLAKVMIASTYPLEIVEAARWSDQHGSLKGKDLDNAVAKQSWDDSVKALARTPTVLKMMNDKLDWTQKLGDAFLAQQDDVMKSVQRLRAKAQSAGSLKSTEQQKVEVHDQTIVIEPTQPDVVYVPYYNPQVVYGAWAYPAYPPYYWPPPVGYAYGSGIAAGIGFATGVAVTAAFWNNAFDWHGGNVYVNNNVNFNNFNRYNNFNNRTNIANRTNTWQHDPAHRRGVNYANSNLRQKYGKGTLAGADARRDFRGFGNQNGVGANNRNGALANRNAGAASTNFDRGNIGQGNRGNLDRGSLAQSNRGNFDRGSFGQGGRGGAFDGVGSGGQTRQFSQRGHQSMSGGFRGARGGGFGRRR